MREERKKNGCFQDGKLQSEPKKAVNAPTESHGRPIPIDDGRGFLRCYRASRQSPSLFFTVSPYPVRREAPLASPDGHGAKPASNRSQQTGNRAEDAHTTHGLGTGGKKQACMHWRGLRATPSLLGLFSHFWSG